MRRTQLYKLLIFVFFCLPFSGLSQTFQKGTLSSIASNTTNDSTIIVGGQVMSSESNSPRVLHGYLPLQYSQLAIVEIEPLELNAYPNPTEGILNLNFFLSDDYEIRISNVEGRMLDQFSVSGNFMQLGLEEMSAGTYFIHVSDSRGQVKYLRVVLNK